MTRKKRLTQALFDNYLLETIDNKLKCQDVVFEYYYERNDFEIELTLEEIREDLVRLEDHEQYERCLMLKDILDRFE
jgi:hypothetical protein